MTLGEVASTLLAGFATQLHANSITIPERQYVAPGAQIAEDGEQLVVALQSIDQGSPAQPFAGTYIPGAEILQATFAVQLIRVIPALYGEGPAGAMIPDAADLGESGVSTVEDAAALVKAAIAIHAAHEVTEGGLMGFTIGPCTPVGPEGGMAGSRLYIAVNLDG